MAEFKFNTDLFTEHDIGNVRAQYPLIYPILYSKQLASIFFPIDAKANGAKKTSRRWGIIAIILVAFSLALGASELVLYPEYHLPPAIPIAAALAGVAGVVIGWFGLIFAGSKRDWLYNRYLTERLRQLHFQFLVHSVGGITASQNAEEVRHLADGQRQVLEAFRQETLLDDDKLKDDKIHSIVSGGLPIWLFPPSEKKELAESPALKEFIKFYKQARFKHQIEFAQDKLKTDKFVFSVSPKQQAKIIRRISWACVAGLLLIHIFVIASSLINLHPLQGPALHYIAILFGIAALAARTLEEGLQPNREVERYRQYLTALKLADREFESARTPLEKLKAMNRIEELSVEEMVNFIKTYDEAKFVM